MFSSKRIDFFPLKLFPQRIEQLKKSEYDVRILLEQKFQKIDVAKNTNILNSVVFYEHETIGCFPHSFWKEFFMEEEADFMMFMKSLSL